MIPLFLAGEWTGASRRAMINSILVAPASEEMSLIELLPYAMQCLTQLEETGVEINTPLALIEVVDDDTMEVSEAPERMVFIALDGAMRDRVLAALETVESREPIISRPRGAVKISLNMNGTLKQIYREMAETPMTALTFSLPHIPGSSGGLLLALTRTAFTVSEMRKEIDQFFHP